MGITGGRVDRARDRGPSLLYIDSAYLFHDRYYQWHYSRDVDGFYDLLIPDKFVGNWKISAN